MELSLLHLSAILLLPLVVFYKSISSNVSFYWYRLSSAFLALKSIYYLPQSTVDSFMKSYDIFYQQKITDDPTDEKHIKAWYSIINQLCAVGEVEKMYIPPIMDGNKSVFENQLLYERKVANDLGISANSHVVDLGCGRGRIAAHISQISGAKVSGINIDKTQIENAKEHAKNIGLTDKLSFQVGSFNDPLPFKDEEFDAMYEVQAFTYAKDRKALFNEIYRVLKPGAKISILDWFLLENYDSKIPYHVDLLTRAKPLIGAVSTITTDEFCDDLKQVGFEVLKSENASINGFQYPLIEKADNFFRFFAGLIAFLVFFRILPRHFKILFDRLTRDGEAFVEGDKLGLFTSCHQIIGRKPAKRK